MGLKCDELKEHLFCDCNEMFLENGNPLSNDIRPYYLKSEVDEAISELKAENKKLKASSEQIVNELFDKVLIYPHEMVRLEDAYKLAVSLKKAKRALWLAHAYKAKFKRWWLHLALDYESAMIRPDTKTIKRIRGKIGNCEKSERKCRAKAEEYK